MALFNFAGVLAQEQFWRLRSRMKQNELETSKNEIKWKVIDPLIHFEDAIACVAVGVRKVNNAKVRFVWRVITGERKILSPRKLQGLGFVSERPLPAPSRTLSGRWLESEVDAYLNGKDAPALADVFHEIRTVLLELVEFPDSGAADVLALYCILTYLFPLFPAIPLIFLHGPRNSGKSTLIEALAQIVFNPLRATDISIAGFYNCVASLRGTFLHDEAERLSPEILTALNDGYKKASGASYVRYGKEFDAFGPKVVAAIEDLPGVTKSRFIEIKMLPRKSESRPKLMSQYTESFSKIRSSLHIYALTRWKKVREAFLSCELPSGVSNRDAEIWMPILTFADLLRAQGRVKAYGRVMECLKASQINQRKAPEEVYFTLLILRRGMPRDSERYEMRASIVARKLGRLLEDEVSAKAAYGLLLRLGFKSRRKSTGNHFVIKNSVLIDLEERYGMKSQSGVE